MFDNIKKGYAEGVANSKKTKDEKEQEKINKFLKKHGLEKLSAYSKPQIEAIMSDLVGNNLMKAGLALSFSKAEDQAKITYLSALVEQNWLIIKQNDEIIKALNENKLH